MRILLVVLLATVTASLKLAPLHTTQESIQGQYIVKLKKGWSLDNVIADLGDVKVLRKYTKVFNGFAAELSERLIGRLRTSEAVEYIAEDGMVHASEVASWGLDRVDQIELPLDGNYSAVLGDGAGVKVYVLDTGINLNHIDWVGRSYYGIDTIDNDMDSEDCNGHGSHCAGTIGGTSYGVAKAVDLIGVRVLGCGGSGSTSGIVAACDWVIEDATLPAVASLSLGGFGNTAMDDAMQAMHDAGITVVVAAGNSDGDACNYSPARSEHAITVGATDIIANNDTRAWFSNYGRCLDIFAPGVDITSAWYGEPDATNTISGTSMACPHVAGAAAVLLANDPSLTPTQVEETLQRKSIADAVVDPQLSPNLLLYIGEGSGGGEVPPELPGCGGYYNSTSGEILSPNYPEFYTNNLDCDYHVEAPDNRILLTFLDFAVEDAIACRYDELTIYDGSDSNSPVLGSFCGFENPGEFLSSSNHLYMHFSTDGSVTYRGFRATYSNVMIGECGDIITSPNGILESPNYPHNYGNHAECRYTIYAETGQTITLTFNNIEIEDHISCGYDAVEVYDGDIDGPHIAKLCGSKIPEPVISTSGMMTVRFVSDSSLNYRGFQAVFAVQQ